MSTSNIDAGVLNRASIVSTVVDAGVALSRGRRKRAAILLGAAALGVKFPLVGTVTSLLVRAIDRLRR